MRLSRPAAGQARPKALRSVAMYKTQVKLQRWICFAALVTAVLIFIYALGLMTDLYMLRTLIKDPKKLDVSEVGSVKARIYYDMQGFNRELLTWSVALIALSVTLFISATQSRRRYYISNYITSGLNACAQVALAIWLHGRVSYWRNEYINNVNLQDLQAYLKRRWERPDSRTGLLNGKSPFTDSLFWFDVHYFLCALAIIAAALLIANAIWKTVLMRKESALLGDGEAVVR